MSLPDPQDTETQTVPTKRNKKCKNCKTQLGRFNGKYENLRIYECEKCNKGHKEVFEDKLTDPPEITYDICCFCSY